MDAQGGVVVDRVDEVNCVSCHQKLDVSGLPSFSEFNCPHCNANQRIPAQFGTFVLLERLGSGGMGVVYRAYDQKLGRFVALKVMKHLGHDEDFEQFCREAQATAQLNHPNVVQIYNFDQDHRLQPYIVMELVSEGRLDDKIAGGRQLDEVSALKTHIDVAKGLQAASEFGLIHGDVKPENILFGARGEAKVVDFGLAKFLGESQHQADGTIMGTPYYVAPEKARGKKVDFRSDIYSLGATLFHVLAGRPPFEGATAVDVVLARLHGPAPDIRQFRADLHPATVALVARMLEPDPAMRFPSYAALLADMNGVLEEVRLGGGVKRPASVKMARPAAGLIARPAGVLFGLRGWKKWAAIGGASAVLLGALGAGAFFFARHLAEKRAAEAEKLALSDAKAAGDALAQRIGSLAQLVAGICTNALDVANKAEAMRQSMSNDEAQQALIGATELSEDVLFGEATAYAAVAAANAAYQRLPDAKTAAAAAALTNELTALADRLVEAHILATENLPLARQKLQNAGKIVQDAVAAERAIQKAAAEEKRRKAEEEKRRLKEEKDRQKAAEEAAKKAALEEQARAEALKESVQKELAQVSAARAKNASLVEQYRFDQAAQSIAALLPQLKTEEAKAAVSAARDAYEQMGKLASFLSAEAGRGPIRGGWLAGATPRDVIAINEKEITVSLGVAGSSMTVEWKNVKIGDLGRMLESATRGVSAETRAGLMLSFALLQYEKKDVKSAERLLGMALKGDPSLRALAERLMPGLVQ